MERANLLELVAALGKAFTRRGMSQHVRLLRIYYWALEKGLTSASHELNVRWSEAFVVDWLKTLRVPPYERSFPVLPRGTPCQRCGPKAGREGARVVDLVFPGGARMRCQTCEHVWIEDDQAEAALALPTWKDRRNKR